MPGITQRIALDGAPEITAAFQQIAKAGTDTFNAIKGAAKDIGLDKDLTPQLDRAKKAAADFGDGFNKAMKSIGDGVQAVTNASAKIGGAVLGVTAALVGLTQSASRSAHEIEQAARRSGQATGEFQKLGFGFKETGVDAGGLTRAFAKISEEANKAAQEGKQSAGAFEKYGIALRGADGHARSITAILSDVADKMVKIENPTERAGIAAELFGARVGTQMVGLLSQGSDGMRAMAADAEKLGVVLGEHQIEAGTKFEQSMVRLSGTVDATRTKFGLLFAPAFTQAANSFADAFAKLQPSILAAGQAIAEGIAPYVKDLAALLTGNAEQIKTGFVQTLYVAFTGLAALVRDVVVPAIRGWGVILKEVGAVVDSVFGAGFGAKFLSHAAGVVALAIAFGTLLKAVQLFAGAFGFILRLVGLGASLSPVGLAIVAIAAAIGLLIVALSHVDWAAFGAKAKEAWDAVKTAVSTAINALESPFKKLASWLSSAIERLERFLGLKSQASGGGAGAGGSAIGAATVTAAGGGFVSGPGTSTSDSIPARLSDGEFVQRSAAVSHYGLGFMHAVNQLRLPRFALGGLVGLAPGMMDFGRPMLRPVRLAAGGPAVAGSILNLTIDSNRFSGLRAPEHVAKALRAYAISRQISSTGRAPSWVR
jgi:hypothetical protein